ncbi:WXG100 family type VII secretion target [Paenibacillus polymyxa]|uniref:WXG100 family type VII secretion target n=1 Tax=Paenibacillus polymyxa TaxID=1406 RepID=UPI0004716FD9|nr:WXG100 family type VII secretion target [Paenibacillus polymyxa]
MGRILVPPDKLMEVADQFLHGKHEMERMLNLLNGRIDFVQQGWSGATRERFFQDFQVSRQSMGVTLERLSTVAQELIFISKNFTQVDGEKVVLDVPGNGVPVKTASSGEGWLHKIFEQIGKAEITKAEAQMEASKLQGEILWDTAQGAKGAIQEDLTLGMLPDKDRDYDHPMAAKVGEILGHVATTLQGAGEVVAGIGGEGLSVAVSSTGVGSIIGIPGLIGSAALAAHGGTTAVKSASGIGKSSAELWQMAKGEGRGSSKSPEVKVEKIPDGLEGTGEIQKRTYEPSPKHDPQSGWGSPNPIPDAETGQKLLDAAYSSSKNKQLYNIYEGKLVKFQPDGEMGWHPYEVTNPAREVPADVLRQFLRDGKITKVEYNKLLRNK